MDSNARLHVVERELASLHESFKEHADDFKDHEEKDHDRFEKVANSLLRIERVLWAGVVGMAAVNGPAFLSTISKIVGGP